MKEKLTDVEKLLVRRAVVASPPEKQPFSRYALWAVLICGAGFLIGFLLVK